MVVNVYEQYFAAEACFNEVRRQGAKVMLIADSEKGWIRYTAAVTFFPHVDEEDYAISYDAYYEQVIHEGKGRRSKKREAVFLEELPAIIDELSKQQNAKVFWNKPLREARRG